jgi:DNA-binding IclR family transcriptional regulator
VVAAVSVAALASRISQQHEPEIVRKVRDAAREIGDRLAVVAG